MSNSEENIRDGVARYLEHGEAVVATLTWAKPRWAHANAAAAAGAVGALVGEALRSRGKASQAKGQNIGLEFARGSTTFVVTTERFITLSATRTKMTGDVTGVEFLSAVPIAEIQEIRSKRLGLTGILTVTPLSGDEFQFETSAGSAKRFAADCASVLNGAAR